MKKKFFIIARIIFIFFMVLGVAIVVALSQIDMNSLRGNLLGVLRNSTGMPIEIDGDVSWKFSLRPQVTMNKVRVPNENSKKYKNLTEAEKIVVGIDLLSLFTGKPTIQRVLVQDANVFIEKNAKGNVVLPTVNEDEQKNDDNVDTAETDVYAEKPDYPFVDPGLGALFVENLSVDINGAQYKLARMAFRYKQVSDVREYTGWIKLDDTVIPVIVSFDKYNQERRVYPVHFAFSSGGDALTADVALEGTSKLPIDFIIKGTIPDVQPIGKFLGTDFPKMPSMKVNIAGGMGHDKVTLHKSSVTVRGSDITASGIFDWSKKQPEINLNIASKKINLMELFPELYGSSHKKAKHAKLNVFKDMPLFGKFLYDKKFSISLNLGKMIMYRNLRLDNMQLDGTLSNAKMRVDLKTGFANGNIDAAINGDIQESGNIDMEMGAIGKRIMVGSIMEQIKISDFISELPINFDVYVRAHGTDMHQVMKNITGPVRLYSDGKGYAHEELVTYMYGGDFLTSLRYNIQDLFSSKKKYDQMPIKCVAANLKLRDGLIETERGVAIETSAINIMLDGNVDLGHETMKLSLTTIPVRGLKLSLTGNVVNTISISGNLAEPDISISGAAIAGKALSATGLGLLLAPLTGGIGLVAGAGVGLLAGDLLENWLADEHPCKTALKSGAPARRHDPEWLDMPVEDLAASVLNPVPVESGK